MTSGDAPWKDGTTQEDTTTTTTTTSSGGSSGGSVADAFFSDRVKAQKFSMFQSEYAQLWGEPATEDYIKAAVNAGLNKWEFASRERQKPAFRHTETYRDKASALAELLHQLGL
jgi:hypothetical protein